MLSARKHCNLTRILRRLELIDMYRKDSRKERFMLHATTSRVDPFRSGPETRAIAKQVLTIKSWCWRKLSIFQLHLLWTSSKWYYRIYDPFLNYWKASHCYSGYGQGINLWQVSNLKKRMSWFWFAYAILLVQFQFNQLWSEGWCVILNANTKHEAHQPMETTRSYVVVYLRWEGLGWEIWEYGIRYTIHDWCNKVYL
jgi:hypothetical protein